MSELSPPGMWRIIATSSGDWCEDCHSDADDGTDRDPGLYVQERKLDGTCVCCGAEIRAGEMLDIPTAHL